MNELKNGWKKDGGAVIKNGYIIYPVFENFHGMDAQYKDFRIVDDRKIAKFNRRDGFLTLDDCMEYADKYFRL